MDPTKKPDTNLSLEELVKRDRMKAKDQKKKTLKPKPGAKKVLPGKKPLLAKGGKTLNTNRPDKGQDLKVRRKIIQKGSGNKMIKNPERKGSPHHGKAPMQHRPAHGKQQQQTPRSSKGPQPGHKTQQQNRAPLSRKESFDKDNKQRERQDNRPAERRDPKAIRFSDVRLKLRNLDHQKVSNFEITQLFEGIGKLVKCKFDYNDFGNFLGSATVQFKRPEDAKKAINEYHGAELEGRIITIEYDVESGKGAGGDNGSGEKSNNVIFLRTNKTMTPEVAMVPTTGGQGNSGIVALSGAVSSASPIVPSHNAGGGAYQTKAYGRGGPSPADRHGPRK